MKQKLLIKISEEEYKFNIKGYVPFYIKEDHELYQTAEKGNIILSCIGDVVTISGENTQKYCLTPIPENYVLINDEAALTDFVDKLQDTDKDEYYYMALMRRGTNQENIYLKKAFVSKSKIVSTIRYWETPIGTYTDKQGNTIYNDELSVYLSLYKRKQNIAFFELLKQTSNVLNGSVNLRELVDKLLINSKCPNAPISVFDVDLFENQTAEEFLPIYKQILGEGHQYVQTKKGFHIIVNLELIAKHDNKLWYKLLLQSANAFNIKECIPLPADGLTPLVGTIHKNIIPKLI